MHLDELMAKLYIEKVDIMEIDRNLVIYFEPIHCTDILSIIILIGKQ